MPSSTSFRLAPLARRWLRRWLTRGMPAGRRRSPPGRRSRKRAEARLLGSGLGRRAGQVSRSAPRLASCWTFPGPLLGGLPTGDAAWRRGVASELPAGTRVRVLWEGGEWRRHFSPPPAKSRVRLGCTSAEPRPIGTRASSRATPLLAGAATARDRPRLTEIDRDHSPAGAPSRTRGHDASLTLR